jgi:phosphatidylglycerophosphate synthase
MITSRYKSRLNQWSEPLGMAVSRLGMTPTSITLAGPVLGALACGWVLRTGAVLPFCAVITAVGLLDGLDGAVARASGRTTKFGAYLDAVCDRLFEMMVVMTAAALTGYWALATGVLAGSLLVSYAKARAAMEVPVSNLEWPDLMERTERCLLFVTGLAAGTSLAVKPLGQDLFWWTLAALNTLVWTTVLQRVLRARALIAAREQGPGLPVPRSQTGPERRA